MHHTRFATFLILLTVPRCGWGQELPALDIRPPAPTLASVQELPLDPEQRGRLHQALQAKDYATAERLLVTEIEAQPKSGELLRLLGGILFLDQQYLNSVIALKRAEALAPLDASNRFTLAMAYIVLDRRDWARPELEKLQQLQPRNPLYLYWLARLDYDTQQFHRGIARLEEVLRLDPNFTKAYDNLALCYEALGQHEGAILTYQKAIDLNRASGKPSPWPALNLGSLLSRIGKLDAAEISLRESIGCDPALSQSRYQLGVVLEKQGRVAEAIQELSQAAALNPAYAEPHYALARIYRRTGDLKKAEESLNTFQNLKQEKRADSTRQRGK